MTSSYPASSKASRDTTAVVTPGRVKNLAIVVLVVVVCYLAYRQNRQHVNAPLAVTSGVKTVPEIQHDLGQLTRRIGYVEKDRTEYAESDVKVPPPSNASSNEAQYNDFNYKAPFSYMDQKTGEANVTWEEGNCKQVDTQGVINRANEYCEIEYRSKNRWFEIIVDYKFTNTRLLYSTNPNYVWVVIPKIASGNIQKALELGTAEGSEVKRLEASSSSAVRPLESAFTFTFIRNPWTRLYAAYRENIVEDPSFEEYQNVKLVLHSARGIPPQDLEQVDLNSSGKSITFTEFLTMLTKVSTEDYSEHWQPWFNMAEPCQINYNKIIYIEDIEMEFEELKDRISSRPDAIQLEGPSRVYNDSDIVSAYKTVPRDIIDTIYDMYKEDFIIGDYNKEPGCIGI